MPNEGWTMNQQVAEAIEKQLSCCGNKVSRPGKPRYVKKKRCVSVCVCGGYQEEINSVVKQLSGQQPCSCKGRKQSHLNVLC